MWIGIVVQLGALAVIVGTGISVVYVVSDMRKLHADQQQQVVRAVSVIEEFRKMQPEFTSLLKSVESDGHALQSVAIQIEGAVASLVSSINFASDRQIAAIEHFRDHVDSQEQQLAKIVEIVSESLYVLPQAKPAIPAEVGCSESRTDEGYYLRLRKDTVTGDSNVRFAVLKDWITMNWLAILRRGTRAWNTAADLIANIPPYLEAQAEVREGCVLIVGTRGHDERLALPIRETDPSSEMHQWFETSNNPEGSPHVPAVLIRSNDQLQLVSKGSAYEIVPGRTHV